MTQVSYPFFYAPGGGRMRVKKEILDALSLISYADLPAFDRANHLPILSIAANQTQQIQPMENQSAPRTS
jgi:uncharacterized membrane-anchored protein